jgi:polyhydroxyalkanoate synthesis regulator phasin
MNPIVKSFFIGRALAEMLGEQVEKALTNALSELGKFDAEQRENLRQFIAEALARAEREASMTESSPPYGSNSGASGSESAELQETIDELRAEIAQLRAELQRYRSRTA